VAPAGGMFSSDDPSSDHFHLAFDGFVRVILEFAFVLDHLPVCFVGQQIDGGIQIIIIGGN